MNFGEKCNFEEEKKISKFEHDHVSMDPVRRQFNGFCWPFAQNEELIRGMLQSVNSVYIHKVDNRY